jgi:DNA polymerase-3 subunit delta
MKIAGGRIEAFTRRPDERARAILIYGADRGQVRERADTLAATVCAELGDPFRTSELEGAQVERDPARLADETAALSFTGGRRVVRIRNAGNRLAEIFKDWLAAPKGEALVLVEAGELAPKAALRKLFEAADNAAALPCYADEGRGLAEILRQDLERHGIVAEADALAYLVENFGGDRLLIHNEVEKLAIYMGNEKRLELAQAIACIGDSASRALSAVAFAAGQGDSAGVEKELSRAFREGAEPIAVLRTALYHFRRLHLAAGHLAGGKDSPELAMAALRPQVFYKERRAFGDQLRRWTPTGLEHALDRLLAAEAECKTTGMPAKAICRNVLFRIARSAAVPARPRRVEEVG